MTLGLLEANEGLGEAQCRIAVTAGLPRASSADQIVERVSTLSLTLTELVELSREREENDWSLEWEIRWDTAWGNAYAAVEGLSG
jgi:hypothetical protein